MSELPISYSAELMPLKTITNLLQRFIPQTRMQDMPDITSTSYRKGLDGPSDTGGVMESPHRGGRKVQSRRQRISSEASTSESLTVMGEKAKTDSASAKADILRRHRRRRTPTDRAKGLMKNGSWNVHLRTPSTKRRKTKNRRTKQVRTPAGRTSEDIGRTSNTITG